MAINKVISYSGTVETNDIKAITIRRVLDEEGEPVLMGYVEFKIGNDVKTVSAPLTAAMKSDVADWLPVIRAFIASELGIS